MNSEKTIAALLTGAGGRGGGNGGAAFIKAYLPQIMGYLTAVLRDDDAREVFSQFCEDFFRGLPRFLRERECSFRAWGFKLAWHAASRFLRDPYRQRGRRLLTSDASRLASVVRDSSFRPGARSERMSKLREALDPEEQTLLILRLDKELSWEELSHVLSGRGEPVTPAALRKRFERLKEKLARLAREQGLIS